MFVPSPIPLGNEHLSHTIAPLSQFGTILVGMSSLRFLVSLTHGCTDGAAALLSSAGKAAWLLNPVARGPTAASEAGRVAPLPCVGGTPIKFGNSDED